MTDGIVSLVSECQLSLPGFEGSVDRFLALVSQHKVSAEEVPVADVTRQFLSHVTGNGQLDLQLAGELMAASARLMMMKSSLLLTQPVPDDGESDDEVSTFDPTQRARFTQAVAVLSGCEGIESLAPFVSPVEIGPRPSPRSPSLLVRAWSEMSGRAVAPTQHVAVPSFVRLEAAVSGLIRTLRSRSRLIFGHIIRGRNRNDAVVHFMAMLELVRQRRVRTEQDELFGEITVHWNADHAESSSRLG